MTISLDPPDDAAPVPPRPGEKVLLIGLLFVLANVGYFGVGLLTDPGRARTLGTALDAQIPFVPWTVYIYAWVYTVMLYPGFVVRCPHLFRRVALAYAVVLLTCFTAWAAFPVTAAPLRGDLATVDPTASFHGWGMWVNYTLDPPVNLFPSLHVAAATLAGLCAWRAHRAAGLAAIPVAAAIGVAVCTVKQHYVVDALAGAALAAAAWWALVRPARTGDRPERELAHGWTGPLLYLAFHTSVYAGLFIAYRAGWAPWR